MVFGVERKVTPPIRLLGSFRVMLAGTAPSMPDLDLRCKDDAAAPGTNRRAKVNVFGIQKEALVKPAYRVERGA
tara:strand:+ start:2532 stop:2753 length:222 start_codon:yes stop_codon:yes gene_type:complete